MKRTVNKISSMLVILLLVVISYSTPVNAATINYTEGTFKYVLDDATKTAEVFDNTSSRSTGAILIPEKVTYLSNQYTVTSIGERAFKDNITITSFVMPDTITTLGDGAFANASKLTKITLSKQIKNISSDCFNYSGLTEIEIPEGVTEIKGWGFANSHSLVDVKLPSTLNHISLAAFANCNIKNIDFPENITRLNDDSFHNNSITNISLPDSVTSVRDDSFSNNKIVNLKLSNSMTYITDSSFKSNLIENLIIPESITDIIANAFTDNKIKNITFLNSNVKLDKTNSPFMNNPIENLYVKSDVDFDKLFNADNLVKGFDGLTNNIINLYTLDDTSNNLTSEYTKDTSLSYNLKLEDDITITTSTIAKKASKAFDLSTKSYVPSTAEPIVIDDATIEWYKESTVLTKSTDTLVGTGKDLTLSNVNANDRGSYYALINGVLKLESIKVNVKINSSVKINYLDEQGKSIAPSTTINGLSSEPYTTTSKKIDGYTLKNTPTNHKGTIEDTQIVVDYVYTKDKVEVTNKPDIVDNTDKDKLPTSGSPAITILVITGIIGALVLTIYRKRYK